MSTFFHSRDGTRQAGCGPPADGKATHEPCFSGTPTQGGKVWREAGVGCTITEGTAPSSQAARPACLGSTSTCGPRRACKTSGSCPPDLRSPA